MNMTSLIADVKFDSDPHVKFDSDPHVKIRTLESIEGLVILFTIDGSLITVAYS